MSKKLVRLKDKIKDIKVPQLIFVCDWHAVLNKLPSLLKKHFHLLQNNEKGARIYESPPTVAYRRHKSIKNYIVKNNSDKIRQSNKSTQPCGKCKLCKNIKNTNEIKNPRKNITIDLKDGGNCNSSGVIYAARCKQHDLICVGHTGEKLRDRFSKHRYDIKYRPDNSELARHFH